MAHAEIYKQLHSDKDYARRCSIYSVICAPCLVLAAVFIASVSKLVI